MEAPFAFRMVTMAEHEVGLWLHDANDPSMAQWTDICKQLVEHRRGVSDPGARIRHLVLTDGGGPNAKQRQMLWKETYAGVRIPFVAVTHSLDNPVKRGLATAITWINPVFRAVPPSMAQAALEHVGLLSFPARIVSELQDMEKAFRPIASLSTFAAHLSSQ